MEEHLTVSLRNGQMVPLAFDWVMMERRRTFRPPPQVLVQRLKELHLEVWQLTGHGPSLQVLEVVRAGQGLPPLAALVRTLRVFLTVPLPQVLVQTVQADH